MIAQANPTEGVTVWGSLQCPYYVHKALVRLFGLPKDRIRVVQTETGGGFGGKEEYPSMLAGHAALLAWKSGKPVKDNLRPRRRYGRDHQAPSVAHPPPHRGHPRRQISRHGYRFHDRRRRVSKRFRRWSSRAARFTPPVRTIAPTCAFAAAPWPPICRRTAPSADLARRKASSRSNAISIASPRWSGFAPEELRRRNFIHQGQTLAVHQVIRETVDMARLMDRAFELSGYHAKRKRFQEENPRSAIKRGIGFAAFLHGAGFTGSGEEYLASEAAMEVTPEGRVRVFAGSTEMGQGTNTVFAQIAAETLGLGMRSDRNHAARHRHGPEQRSHGSLAHHHDRRKARGVRRARGPEIAFRAGFLQARLQRRRFRRARAGNTSTNLARCSRSPNTNIRPIFTGTTQHTRATRTAPTPGRSTSPKFPSIRAPPKCASRISSPCRKSAR